VNAGAKKVQFVCVRPAHHRRCAMVEICEHVGLAAYCPAGDIGGHDWMPTSTDVAALLHLGFIVGVREGDIAPADKREDDEFVLIRA
jgi:hypothetical protein